MAPERVPRAEYFRELARLGAKYRRRARLRSRAARARARGRWREWGRLMRELRTLAGEIRREREELRRKLPLVWPPLNRAELGAEDETGFTIFWRYFPRPERWEVWDPEAVRLVRVERKVVIGVVKAVATHVGHEAPMVVEARIMTKLHAPSAGELRRRFPGLRLEEAFGELVRSVEGDLDATLEDVLACFGAVTEPIKTGVFYDGQSAFEAVMDKVLRMTTEERIEYARRVTKFSPLFLHEEPAARATSLAEALRAMHYEELAEEFAEWEEKAKAWVYAVRKAKHFFDVPQYPDARLVAEKQTARHSGEGAKFYTATKSDFLERKCAALYREPIESWAGW